MTLELQIKSKASEIGFDACGISPAAPLSDYEQPLRSSLQHGYNGRMGYLSYSLEKRLNPQLVLPGARSVISLLISYYVPPQDGPKTSFRISRYAWGTDYHEVIGKKLDSLITFIKELMPASNSIAFVDASPVLEKALAVRSGLGHIGKNSILINPRLGSFCFIAEILTDAELAYDEPFSKDLCASCTRCLDACPTGALVAPHTLDARLCISYNTIEAKEPVPDHVSNNIGRWIYGCDICQDVCPWNHNPPTTHEPLFLPNEEIVGMTDSDWLNLDEARFSSLFASSSIKRTKLSGIKKNIEAVTKNK